MVVYAIEPYTYVYGQHAVGHKQGKAFVGRPLNVIGEWGDQWLEISPLVLDRPIDESYPSYWVYRDDVVMEAPVDDPPVVIEFGGAGEAFVYLMTWIRELWR